MINNEKMFYDALNFVMDVHKGQHRKFSDLPYIIHPMEAAVIASTLTNDMEVIVAAMLHDVLEDTDIPDYLINKYFSGRVMELVMSETEPSFPDQTEEQSWAERKKRSLEVVRETRDMGVKIVWLADKLSNMRSIYRMYLEEGDALWNHFHQKDPYVQVEYYRELKNCFEPLSDTAAYKEYCHYLDIVFRR